MRKTCKSRLPNQMHRHQTQVQSSSLSAPCPSCGEEEVESSQKCTHSQTNQHYCHRINECHFSTSNKYYQFTIKRGTLYVSVKFFGRLTIFCVFLIEVQLYFSLWVQLCGLGSNGENTSCARSMDNNLINNIIGVYGRKKFCYSRAA